MRYVFSKRRKQILSIAKSAGEFSEILLQWLDVDKNLSADVRPERIDASHWRLLDDIVK